MSLCRSTSWFCRREMPGPERLRCLTRPHAGAELGRHCLPASECVSPSHHPFCEVLMPTPEDRIVFATLRCHPKPNRNFLLLSHKGILFFLISLSIFMNRSHIFPIKLESEFISSHLKKGSSILKGTLLLICDNTQIFY